MSFSEDRPQLIAHRGYSECYPENTLVGLEAALVAGADYIEFDVQFSEDGVPIVIHDEELKRTTGVEAKVSQTHASKLATLNAGETIRFGDRFQNEPIPTLDTALQLLNRWPQAKACVEIKAETVKRFGADPVAQLMTSRLQPFGNRCVLISFDVSVLEAAKHIGMNRVGWVIHKWGERSHQLAQKLNPSILFCNYKKIPDDENALWQGGWQWGIYDVVDTDIALQWINRGVHYIETWDIGGMLSQKNFVSAINR